MTTTASRSSGAPPGRSFRIAERGSTVRTEVLGGAATFLTMSYIVFVNPAILEAAGLPFDAVAVCTALAAALFTALMGAIANLPLALASGLGINAIVAFDLILGREVSPAVGMACVVIEGLLALALVIAGLREAILRAVPGALKIAIGVGIGLFITLVGLREGGIVVNDEATGIGLGDLSTGPPLIALGGILVAVALAASARHGAILAGIATSTVLGLLFGVLEGPDDLVRLPRGDDFAIIGDSLSGSALQGALTVALIPVIFTLFMTDFFDTVGTAFAVSRQAGLSGSEGEVPNARRVLLVDSAAAAGGGVMGVSSVTTYVESGAGVAEGARTGLASLVTAGLFVLTIFLVPLVAVVGQGVTVVEGTAIHPAIAPALVLVGALMLRLVAHIDWSAPESWLPAFLTIAAIPLTFSIAAGIGLGIIGYALVMAVRGRAREVHGLIWVLVPLFVAFFASDWLAANVF
jgi:AGZA family xanthine/uracil permease-like MFS transporter